MVIKSGQKGFTIVELLIVVVVIGILAAIVTVAYTGIQSRARDSAVQSELKGFGKAVEVYHALNGAYPTGSQLASEGGVKVNKAMYLAGNSNNWYYCISTDGSRFAVGATAESSRAGFRYDSVDGLEVNSNVWGATTCPNGVGDPYEGTGAASGCVWASGTCAWQAWISG